MNKKGFMFIETIIVSVVLMIGLLYVYESFSTSISKEKVRINYNTTANMYKLYFLKKFLIEEFYFSYNSPINTNSSASTIMNGDIYVSGEELFRRLYNIKRGDDPVAGVFLAMKNVLEIKRVSFVKCAFNLKSTNNLNRFEGATDAYKSYIKTIKSCSNNNHYRFIAEFYNNSTDIYSYGWAEFPQN